MSDMAISDAGLSVASLDDVPNISSDLLQTLGVNPGILPVPFTATAEMADHIGPSAGAGDNSAAANWLMAHQPFAGWDLSQGSLAI
jgi:hypothetical protein